jgi:hypothetical protein
MPKLTPEQRADLEAQLAEDDADDESDEVTIGRPDGSTFTGTFRRALQLGFVTLPEPKKPAAKKEAAPRNVSVFGQRRTS